MLHYQRGRIALAIDHVEQAVRLEPTTARFRSNLGIVYRAAGRLGDALASGREAVRLKPEVAEAHNSLGVTWQQVARSEHELAGSSPEPEPWEHPTMRLFRQSRLGHWPEVIQRLRFELERAGAARPRSSRANLL